MPKKVLFTYNEKEAEDNMANAPGSLLLSSLGYTDELREEMIRQGFEVSEFSPDIHGDIEQELKRFEAELDGADFVFHRTPMLRAHFLPLFDPESSSRKRKKAIGIIDQNCSLFESIIMSRHLERVHFSSTNAPKDYKLNLIRIADEAGINVPPTWPARDITSSQEYPIVMKHGTASMGDHNYILKSADEFNAFFGGKTLVFDIFHQGPKGYSQRIFVQKPRKDEYMAQKFIETPGNHDCHYRVFVTGDGTILCSALYVSEGGKDDRRKELIWKKNRIGPVTDIFGGINGELYLALDKATSNPSSGGKPLPLDRNDNSAQIEERHFPTLEAHGLDPEYPQLPEDLREQAYLAGRTFGRNGFIYGAIDWILDIENSYTFLGIVKLPEMGIFGICFDNGNYENSSRIGYEKIVGAMKNWRD
jgi:hypothetical protein